MNRLLHHVTLPLAGLLCSCVATGIAVDGGTGDALTLESIADRFAELDVVFLGEEHDNDAGHAMQLELLTLLHQRRPDTILSMEMFERDVQDQLDLYLSGGIGEEQFLAESRPWANYAKHYRPLVEYARSHGLAVVAANMPRPLAKKVSADGAQAVEGDPNVARESTAPEDKYYELFKEAMGGGAEDPDWDRIQRFYVAQCYKDDTMAESIAKRLVAAWGAGRRPLVVHVCGKFHSDHGEGTVSRLRSRLSSVDVAVISMLSAGRVSSSVAKLGPDAPGEVLWIVPEMRSHPVRGANPHKTEDQTPATDEEGSDDEEVEYDSPALGFTPAFGGSAKGVAVDAVSEGGPAADAGLLAGDVIVQVDGAPLADLYDYAEVLDGLTVGKTVEVVVTRDGARVTLSMVVGTR